MTIDLNLKIEEVVKQKAIPYMDAVLEYAVSAGIEPEARAKRLKNSLIELNTLQTTGLSQGINME